MYGGGLSVNAGSSFVALPASALDFSDNRAALQGGGLNAQLSRLSLRAGRAAFAGNTAGDIGGALMLVNVTADLAGNCTVRGGAAAQGGGLIAYGSAIRFAGGAVAFRRNAAGLLGGGVCLLQRSSLLLNGSATFQGPPPPAPRAPRGPRAEARAAPRR